MDELSLMELIAAFLCVGLMVDFRKEPEKYGLYSAGLNTGLYAAIVGFVCSVLYGLMLWMPCQGIATFVRFATATIVSIIIGVVLKKHKNTLCDEVCRQLFLACIFCVGCAADVAIAAIGL